MIKKKIIRCITCTSILLQCLEKLGELRLGAERAFGRHSAACRRLRCRQALGYVETIPETFEI